MDLRLFTTGELQSSRITRFGLVSLFLCTILISCDKSQSSESGLSGLESNAPVFVVDSQSANEIVVSVTIPPPNIRPVMIEDKEYSFIEMDGLEYNELPGKLDIPSLSFTLNTGFIQESSFALIYDSQAVTLPLESEVAHVDRERVHSPNPKKFLRDTNNIKDYVFPGLIQKDRNEEYGDGRFLRFKMVPFELSPNQSSIKYFPKFKIKVSFRPVAAYRSSLGNSSYLSSATLNGKTEVASYHLGSNENPVDLLIAHTSFKESKSLAKYLDFKKAAGREVKVEFVERKSAEQVREIIIGYYRKGGVSTTMLLGNIDHIPSFRGSGDNTWTDYDYQVLSPEGAPEVALGRVPAHNEVEFTNFVEKYIARETQNFDVNSILATAGDDQSLGCPSNIKKVTKKFEKAIPASSISKAILADGSTRTEVISGYNSNPNIIVYDGHGYQEGMAEIPLLTKHLDELKNSVFPVLLDIACLNANWSGGAKKRNFAESILLAKGRGVSGIMAAGGSSGGHGFFNEIARIMSEGRLELSKSGKTEFSEIGKVILAAKVNASMSDRTYFNYYGDPSTRIFEKPNGNLSGNAHPFLAVIKTGDSYSLYLSQSQNLKQSQYCLGSAQQCQSSQAQWRDIPKGILNGSRLISPLFNIESPPSVLTVKQFGDTGTDYRQFDLVIGS